VWLLRVWHPERIFRFEHEPAAGAVGQEAHGVVTLLRAWCPFVLLTILVGNWGLPVVKQVLDVVTVRVPVPLLNGAVISPTTGAPIAAVYTINWLSAAGTAILTAALLSAFVMRVPARVVARTFVDTLGSLWYPLITIGSVLGLAYVGNASGMMTTLGLALAATGALFPLFSPLLGWLGVFLTGSDTSANAVFGKLQAVTAESLGLDPVLTVAANSSGGVTGKMISPQSIAVACAATGLVGRESQLFRFTFVHSLIMVAILCVITWLQANALSWMIPAGAAAGTASTTAPFSVGVAVLAATFVVVLALVALVRVRGTGAAPVGSVSAARPE
jgi:lactate permease